MNPAGAVHIRSARADDAEFLAYVMLHSSRAHVARGIWDLRIGATDEGCLEYLRRLALAEPHSPCHYESFLVAEADGQPAAALCGFDPRSEGWALAAQAMDKVERDLNWSEEQLSASDQRLAPLWPCFLADEGADWIIEFVATRPECRRRGLASSLLEEVVRRGAARGAKLAQIATFIGNEPAISVYLRAGFRIAEEKPCQAVAATLNAPGFVRLIRTL